MDLNAPWNGQWQPLDETHEILIEQWSNRNKNNEKEYPVWLRKKGEHHKGDRVIGPGGQQAFPSVAAAWQAAVDFLNRT